MTEKRGPGRVDVVILGAGAAGLAAARVLGEAQRTVVVVEARERTGGRAFTLEGSPAPFPIELGAEFVHGRPHSTLSLLREIGAFEVDIVGGEWQERGGVLEPAGGDRFEIVEQMLRRVDDLPVDDESVDAYLARFAGDPALATAREWTRAIIEGFDAADPARASIRALGEEWNGDESVAAESRPSSGYGRLMKHLVRGLDPAHVHLRLQTTVEEVRWEPGGVTVSAGGPLGPVTIEARRAIVTFPVGVLQRHAGQSGAVTFDPALPLAKTSALERLVMGPVVKVVLWFRTPFWQRCNRGAYRDAAFFYAKDRAFPSIWTAYPMRAPLLTAWAGGPAAERLGGARRPALVSAVLDELTAFFGSEADPAKELVAAFHHDWQHDPLARGAYSYVTVGGAGARAALAAPLGTTLFFAGEATAKGGASGTVGGAMHSGIRAAQQVLEAAR